MAVEGEAVVVEGLAALEEEGEVVVVGMIVAEVVVGVVGGTIAVVGVVEGQGEVGVEVGEVGILEIPYSQGLSICYQYIYL